MKLDYLNNEQPKSTKRIISIGLLGVSAFMAALILIKVMGYLTAPARAEDSVRRAAELCKADANDVQKYLAKSKEIAEELKKKNFFAPPPPKKHPVSQVSGILGSEALINGKWYKVGDKVGDAKIVAIESTLVKIEWEGKEKVFAPISAKSAPEPKKVVKKAVVEKKAGPKKTEAKVEKAVVEKVATEPVEEDPLAWMGVTLSEKLREKFLERWNKSSDEEKQKMQEQWGKVPDEQKQQMIDQMEQNIDML